MLPLRASGPLHANTHLALVRSMATLLAKLRGQLATGLEGAIRVALGQLVKPTHD